MPEFIDRYAILKKIYDHPPGRERMTDGEWCRKCIYEAPKVESEQAQYGRWILCEDQHGVDNDNNNYAYFCSQCYYQDVHSEYAEVNFCWHCGARMNVTDTNVGCKGDDNND